MQPDDASRAEACVWGAVQRYAHAAGSVKRALIYAQDLKWEATDYEPVVQRHVLYWAEENRCEEVADQIYEVRKVSPVNFYTPHPYAAG